MGGWLACLLLAGGCGASGLRTLPTTEAQYLVGVQRAMPAVVDAHDIALKGVIARAQESEDQAPSRDAVHEALERLMKHHRDHLALAEAARAARSPRWSPTSRRSPTTSRRRSASRPWRGSS